MTESPILLIYYHVSAITNRPRAETFERLACEDSGVLQTDINLPKRMVRIAVRMPFDFPTFKQRVASHGFHLEETDDAAPMAVPPPLALARDDSRSPASRDVCHVRVDGMTCRACEINIERCWKKIEGITDVRADAATGNVRIKTDGCALHCRTLEQALNDPKYRVHLVSPDALSETARPTTHAARPSFLQLVGLFALVLLLGSLLSKLGVLKPNVAIGAGMSIGAIFLLGLVAASSSCVAVTGGLLLSTAETFRRRYGSSTAWSRMQPVLLFVAGRIIGYGLLGGLLGMIGNALAPSTALTAIITVFAALFMLIMGLEMLGLAPAWLKRLLPRTSKSLSHKIMDAERKEHPIMPPLLGAATFFLPCGFTQALQLYALTTKSFLAGATTLAVFALGTAPALLLLGYATSSIKGKLGTWFFRFTGALVVVLGVWNLQNGLAIAGVTFSLPNFSTPAADANASFVPLENGVQIVRMSISTYGGYEPNVFTIRKGVPVRWEINVPNAAGCASVLISRPLGIRKYLTQGSNVLAFTPNASGIVPFSCSMGMYRGSFTVI